MDEAIIAAARLGDRGAQAALLSALQDSWYRLSLGLLGDPERARDATQETALRFLTNLPAFRGESQLKTWSFGIAINVVREIKRAVRPALDCDDPQAAVETPGLQSPESLAELAEAREHLRAVLYELPDRQREAVVLRFFEDLSVEQTARVMRCATGTVKATVHQALRTLRKRLQRLT